MEDISYHLNQTLESRGISLEELAQRSGISAEVLQEINTNPANLTVSDLQRISSALNISFQIGDTTI
ncbi:helix-turn-helix domain-containing protein [Aquibacillus halophilus]|uniref:helix-turn-helix domain-containing protein n=1 Tax=Aquibacillus halophilus TaxID=930132 RepID=UPI00129B34D9|nr:helix-turn-helix transcriptional regulator [Aquibacillus halophilus]